MNGEVSGKEEVMHTPYSDLCQNLESNAQTPLQHSDDSCTSDNSNNHRSGDSDSEEGDGHDSGISSDDEDDRTTYTAVQLTNDSLDSQRYTGICIPTPTDGWVGENNHQTGLSGNLPNGSNNPQIFESTDSVQLDSIVFSNLIQLSLISQEHNSTCNDHVICDSGHNSDDEDQIPEDFPSRKRVRSIEIDQFEPLYKKRKIEAQNNQKYTENVCNPTNGGLLGESDNQQISEDTEITSDCNPDDSDPKGNEGYGSDGSCESKENLTKGAGGSNQTFEGEQKSSEFPKVNNWSDSDGNSEDSSDCGDDDVGHYDTDCGKRYSHLSFHDENTNIIKKDSFSLAQIELNKAEEEKYESIWQEMDKILSSSREVGLCEDDIEELKGRLDEVISQALEQGIMFTFPYKDGESFVDHIINTIQALYWVDSTENFRLLEEKKILQVISEGATLNRFTKENHDNYVNCIYREKEILSQRNKNILGLNNLAYESIVNKSKQTQNVLGVDKDNRYFCIEYSQDSIVEVAEILNNEKAKDLNLRVGILKIGESIVRVENVEEIGGKRNYMDVSKGGIEMSFTTEVGKISVYLSPSEKGSNKIKVEIDGENRARLNELKDKGKSLGENCLLGGKSVEEAIEHESFERYGSVPNTAMKEPSLDCVANITRGG
ncbi:hypothetical protein [Wolbachia endosymbiont (group A) of Lasioglossum morio]|uniref:hypothetical protein n=1 Tax=Wolbachia endosymbiont (group A) of Lasioglossum morio TaxID=2954025 RepID=UPI002226D90F|nr:hypothetical protein [Wolbachia endosymbiont (group A) of Lasioglossum morio]